MKFPGKRARRPATVSLALLSVTGASRQFKKACGQHSGNPESTWAEAFPKDESPKETAGRSIVTRLFEFNQAIQAFQIMSATVRPAGTNGRTCSV